MAIKAEIQRAKGNEQFLGHIPLGTIRLGELNVGETLRNRFTIPAFPRERKTNYRVSLQLLDTTGNGELFMDDITGEF